MCRTSRGGYHEEPDDGSPKEMDGRQIYAGAPLRQYGAPTGEWSGAHFKETGVPGHPAPAYAPHHRADSEDQVVVVKGLHELGPENSTGSYKI